MFFYILIFLIIYYILLILINGKTKANGPKHYPGYVPYFGVFLELIKHGGLIGLVNKLSKENEGIFSIFLLGKKIYYIYETEVFSEIYKSKNVEFGQEAKRLGENILGANKKEERDKNINNEEHDEKVRNIVIEHLQGEGLNKITKTFLKIANEKIDKLTETKSQFYLMEFIYEVLYHSATKAMLGESFDSDSTKEPFFYFDKSFPLLAIGIPDIFVKEIIKAREYVKNKCLDIKVDETCDFIYYLIKNLTDNNLDHRINTTVFGFMFASQINTINGNFWNFYQVLKDEDIKNKIQKEIEDIYDPEDIRSIDKMTTLNLLQLESVRYANYGVSISLFQLIFRRSHKNS
jgi:cytochrome P450